MKRIAFSTKFALGAWVVLAVLTAMPANAQNRGLQMLCADRSIIVGELTGRYGEQVHGMGLAHQNRIVEVYVSEETGSWTITVTSADGTTCLMAAGQHFAQMPPAIPGEDL
ncbi:hypothetical protein A8B78_06080 [Jannaschia sp. EhC01]|nr:hypothetical protein A8B78_06080 [Jannaschia sp. EhC01]